MKNFGKNESSTTRRYKSFKVCSAICALQNEIGDEAQAPRDVVIIYVEGLCIHGGGTYPGRVWRMWFYLISYDLFMFSNIGTTIFQTIYFLSPPLCFSTVTVGVQSVSVCLQL